MSYVAVHSRVAIGIEALAVRVEVDLSAGLVGMNIVGMAEMSVRESRDRVRAAIINSGFDFPQKRILVNLQPADVPKHGGGFDLPIAIGVLLASGQIKCSQLEEYEFIGELALDGSVKSPSGLLVLADECFKQKRIFVSARASLSELHLLAKEPVVVSDYLRGIVDQLESGEVTPIKTKPKKRSYHDVDLKQVRGHVQARYALEVAAAGGHGLFMTGPPGSGKSLLAQCMSTILPSPSAREELDVAKIYSISGQEYSYGQRTFRAPHHSASGVSIIGGGARPAPGEISLAHFGVLFLDELPEFNQHLLDMLREPIENGEVVLARAAWRATFPAQFQLVAAANPCKCGYYGYGSKCHCDMGSIVRYKQKISGPLKDRFDIRIDVLPVDPEVLLAQGESENSACVRERVEAAWLRQIERQGCGNARLNQHRLDNYLPFDQTLKNKLAALLIEQKITPRGIVRVKRLTLTIYDLSLGHKPIHECLYTALALRGED